MKVGLELSFKRGAIEGRFYIDLFERFVKFRPHSFTKKHSTKPWDEMKHKKIIAGPDNADVLIIDNREHDIFITNDTGSVNPVIL